VRRFTFTGGTGYFFVGAWNTHVGVYAVPEVDAALAADLDPYAAAP
jgi:hypothetical protein